MAAAKGIGPSRNKLMDIRTIQSSLNEDYSGTVLPLFVFFILHATYWWANTAPLERQEATIVRKWLCSLQEPTAALCVFFSSASLSPACPSSLLLFTHRQLSQFPNAAIPSNILCSWFFFLLLLLFSCPLGCLPLPLFLGGLFLGWGGRGWGRNREKKKKKGGGWVWGVTFAALWLTTCVSRSLYLHVSHGKEGGGRGRWERKDRHMVLVCWVKSLAGLFVSCNKKREIHSPNHLQIYLFLGQWWCFSLI